MRYFLCMIGSMLAITVGCQQGKEMGGSESLKNQEKDSNRAYVLEYTHTGQENASKQLVKLVEWFDAKSSCDSKRNEAIKKDPGGENRYVCAPTQAVKAGQYKFALIWTERNASRVAEQLPNFAPKFEDEEKCNKQSALLNKNNTFIGLSYSCIGWSSENSPEVLPIAKPEQVNCKTQIKNKRAEADALLKADKTELGLAAIDEMHTLETRCVDK